MFTFNKARARNCRPTKSTTYQQVSWMKWLSINMVRISSCLIHTILHIQIITSLKMYTNIHKNLFSRFGTVCFTSINLHKKKSLFILAFSVSSWTTTNVYGWNLCVWRISLTVASHKYHVPSRDKTEVSDSAQLTSELSGTSAARGDVGNLFFITETGVLNLNYPQLCDNGRCITKTKMLVFSLQQQLFTGNAIMNTAMFQHQLPMFQHISLTCSNMSI